MTIVIFLMLVEFAAFAPNFGASQQLIRSNYSNLFRGYDMEQRIAYRIGQVECLKSLLQGENNYLGLGSLHRGNYSRDVSRFALKQRIAYLLGQVNCLKIHLDLNQDLRNDASESSNINPVYIDCKDAYQQGSTTDGIYLINPDNQTAFPVYCNMSVDGGGWVVLQRRFDGSVDFNQTWTVCEHTFGNMTGEYWLGLIKMHRLTASAPQELRIDLEDFFGYKRYARYSTFTVDSATTQYRLTVSGYSGNFANNGMWYSSGARFSTKDRDYDSHPNACAVICGGPWWHKSCTRSNLNGKYYNRHVTTNNDAIYWMDWRGIRTASLKKVDMKIRRK